MKENQAYLNDLKAQIDSMSPYEQVVSRTMLLLGEALCLVITHQDKAVLAEMKRIINEVFQQAEAALQNDRRSIQ